MTPLEKYAQVVLHSGCAIPPINETESRKHKFEECRLQKLHLRRARKHQHKLQSNGLAIGYWVKLDQPLICESQDGFDGTHPKVEVAECNFCAGEVRINAPVSQR